MSATKSQVTCHVLDASTGKAAVGVAVRLQEHHQEPGEAVFSFNPVAHGTTDSDGRCTDLLALRDDPKGSSVKLSAGLYKIIFRTKEFFEATQRKCFYPWVEITFELENPDQHYHIPLLISPYSFTTYRGT